MVLGEKTWILRQLVKDEVVFFCFGCLILTSLAMFDFGILLFVFEGTIRGQWCYKGRDMWWGKRYNIKSGFLLNCAISWL